MNELMKEKIMGDEGEGRKINKGKNVVRKMGTGRVEWMQWLPGRLRCNVIPQYIPELVLGKKTAGMSIRASRRSRVVQ